MKSLLAGLFSCLTAAMVFAAPSGGDYVKDIETTEVTDRTTSAIRTLNTFICVFAKAIPADMVNRPPYLALVRLDECGGPQAAGIQILSVTSTRGRGDAPQVSKGHFYLTLVENAAPVTMYFHLEASEPRSERAPNGVFTLEMSGQIDGKRALRGRIVASASQLTMVLNGDYFGQQETFQLALKNTSDAGAPRVAGMLRQALSLNGKFQKAATYRFAEGANYYCRQTVDVGGDGVALPAKFGCFDRSASAAVPLSVAYGLYDDAGARVRPDASGIAIRDDSGHYGYASHRLVSPPTLASGSSVTRADGTGAYTVFRAPGSLDRTTSELSSIDTLEGDFFEVELALPDLTGVAESQRVYMSWAAQKFKLLARLVCAGTSITDCGFEEFPRGTTLSGPELAQRLQPATTLAAFSNGTMFDIDLAEPSKPKVRREFGLAIGPSDAKASEFVCLVDCPDLDAMKNAADISEVYRAGPVTYRWDPATLSLSDTQGRVLIADQPNLASLGMDPITSGPLLLPADLESAVANCTPKTLGQPCTAEEILAFAPVHYRWSMPLDSAQRPAFLRKNGSTFVELFPQPKKVSFTMPASAPEFAGVEFDLQLDTESGLAGIPVDCFNGIESVGVDSLCLPLLRIPDGSEVYVDNEDGTRTRLWVRSLQREILLLPVAPSQAAEDVKVNLDDDLLPEIPSIDPAGVASDLADPSNPASRNYAGSPPSPSYFQATTASVVDGKRIDSATPVPAK